MQDPCPESALLTTFLYPRFVRPYIAPLLSFSVVRVRTNHVSNFGLVWDFNVGSWGREPR